MGDSIADILAQAENPAYIRVTTAKILIRQDLVVRHEQLDAEIERAIVDDSRENRIPVAPQLAEQLAELEREIEDAKVVFRFRSIGKRAWTDLMAAHPPTKEQKRADNRAPFNPLTFPCAAIAASVEPTSTPEEIHRLELALNDSQFDVLFDRCIDAQIGGLDAPKSVTAGAILRVKSQFESSATAVDAQSLAASSSAG